MGTPKVVIPLLVVVTLAVYAQVGDHGFIEFDDDRYVFENAHVRAGLSWQGVVWAFGAPRVSNWHPVTWLSHMIDGQLYGDSPRGPHLTNLALHIVNTLLLLLVLQRLTGAFGRSAFVAGLFALHPLHVESVAWISERKDLLSTFFWWLCLWLYAGYVRGPSLGRYLGLLASFALGLMSKSMLVTLPFTLLLLDLWPLGRLRAERAVLGRLIREKLPLFLLSAAFCVVTVVAQRSGQALISLDRFPLDVRISNALLAYVGYLAKTFWPHPLAAFYPHPVTASAGPALGCALLLAAITFAAWRAVRSEPAWLFGWLWYLGTLVPVIGLVQVGSQALADRYTYVSLVGVFIMLAWGVPALRLPNRVPARYLRVAAIGVLLPLAFVSWRQAGLWRDTETLFRHTLAVTEDNSMAHGILGTTLGRRGEFEEAIVHYREALRLKPDLAEAHNNLGIALHRTERLDEAVVHYREALRLKPDHYSAHNNLAAALHSRGRPGEAVPHYEKALRIRPGSPGVLANLALALEAQGRREEAVARYQAAVRLDPGSARLRRNLGALLIELGRLDAASEQLAVALRIEPEDERTRATLGQLRSGRPAP